MGAARLPFFVLLLAALLGNGTLTAGCSTTRLGAEHAIAAREYTVSVRPLGPDTQGEHRGWNRTIYLDPRVALEETLARHVATHELGHALMRGGGHVPPPAIMAASHGCGEALISSLTPQEVRAASGAVPTLIRADSSVPPVVYDALAWGCALWNRSLARPVLTLAPR